LLLKHYSLTEVYHEHAFAGCHDNQCSCGSRPGPDIIDEDRRRNAQLFEDAFYGRRNLNPKMKEEDRKTVDVPEDVDPDLLAKVLTNPEMKALLVSLAKAVGK